MVYDEVPSYVEDLNVKMDFIGHVPPGQKVSIYLKRYLDPEDWTTRPLRWLYWEDSNSTCEYIQKIVDTIGQVLSVHRSPESKTRLMIIEACKKFRQGLRNLINTYASNPITSAKLRTSLSLLNIKVPESSHDDEQEVVGTTPVPGLTSYDYGDEENTDL